MKQQGLLLGRTALITGASVGIGRAIAFALAEEGAALMLCGRNEEALDSLNLEILDRGGKSVHYVCDITTNEGLEELTRFTELNYPVLDILVHNAGVGSFDLHNELSDEDWDFQMNTNARAIFQLTRSLEPMLWRSSSPLIIGILSDASIRYFSHGSLYSASKAAAHAYLASLRKEWQGSGMRVTSIYPGVVATAFDGNAADAPYKEDWLQAEDVASAVRYVCTQPDHVLVDEIVIHPISQTY